MDENALYALFGCGFILGYWYAGMMALLIVR